MTWLSRIEFLTSKHFILRVISSVFLVSFALLLTWQGGMAFNAVWCIIAGLVAWEWWRIVRQGHFFWKFLGIVYALLVAAGPILIRIDAELGFQALIWAFSVIWTTDIMAYIFGRSIGGIKLWPKISPNKTWSGFLGGILSGTLMGMCLAYFWIEVPALLPVALLSLLAAVATQGGDLLESYVKRRFNVKDSGTLIPGHGGFMDRLDGCIVACAMLAAIGAINAGVYSVAQGILLW